MKITEREKLENFRNLTLYFYEHLHAKCYANERSVVVSSMNLYDFSEQKNWEMGVLLTEADGDAFRRARVEIDELIQSSSRQAIGGVRGALSGIVQRLVSVDDSKPKKRKGYCVRCKTILSYGPNTHSATPATLLGLPGEMGIIRSVTVIGAANLLM